MKKQVMKAATSVKSTLVKTALVFVLAGSVVPAMANGHDSVPTPVEKAEVKYLGAVTSGQLLFQVEFENQGGETVYLTIKDQDGYVFYQQSFKDKKLMKKFIFDRNENDNANLIFTVSTQKGKQSQSFRVDTRVVEQTEVTKL